jgi:hypothetical protein
MKPLKVISFQDKQVKIRPDISNRRSDTDQSLKRFQNLASKLEHKFVVTNETSALVTPAEPVQPSAVISKVQSKSSLQQI